MMFLLVQRDLLHLLEPFLSLVAAQYLRSTCRLLHRELSLRHRWLYLRNRADGTVQGLEGMMRPLLPLDHVMLYCRDVVSKLAGAASTIRTTRLAHSLSVAEARISDLEVLLESCQDIVRRVHLPTFCVVWPRRLPLLESLGEHQEAMSVEGLAYKASFVDALNRSAFPRVRVIHMSRLERPIRVRQPHLQTLTLRIVTESDGIALSRSLAHLPCLQRLEMKELHCHALVHLVQGLGKVGLTHLEIGHLMNHEVETAGHLLVVLSACTNLRNLSLYFLEHPILTRFFQHLAARAPEPLHAGLTTLTLGGMFDMELDVSTRLQDAWPALKSLYLHARQFGHHLDDPDPPLCPILPGVKTLHLHGQWDWMHLEACLANAKDLQTLRVEVFDDQVGDLALCLVGGIKGLVRLETVVVHVRCYDDTDDDHDLFLPSIERLVHTAQRCPRLRRLELPGYSPTEVDLIQNRLLPLGIDFESPERDLL